MSDEFELQAQIAAGLLSIVDDHGTPVVTLRFDRGAGSDADLRRVAELSAAAMLARAAQWLLSAAEDVDESHRAGVQRAAELLAGEIWVDDEIRQRRTGDAG